MEDFEKNLIKEGLELQLKIQKNKVFIWSNKKFKELSIELQKAQLRQYFAQEEYAEALSQRMMLLLGGKGIHNVYENIKNVFIEKYKGCSLHHRFKGEDNTQETYHNIQLFNNNMLVCDGMETFQFSCLTLYALLLEKRYEEETCIFTIE